MVKKQKKLEKTNSGGYTDLLNTKIMFAGFPFILSCFWGNLLTHPAISYQGAVLRIYKGKSSGNQCWIPGMGTGIEVLDSGFRTWRSPEWVLRGAVHVGRKNLDLRPTSTALGAWGWGPLIQGPWGLPIGSHQEAHFISGYNCLSWTLWPIFTDVPTWPLKQWFYGPSVEVGWTSLDEVVFTQSCVGPWKWDPIQKADGLVIHRVK